VTQGFHRALLASSLFLLGAAVVALRATNTRGEPVQPVDLEAVLDQPWEPILEHEAS
jgi:hypothetical protein